MCAPVLFAQDLKADLQAALAYYSTGDRLSVELEAHIYTTPNDEKAAVIQRYAMQRNGNAFAYDMEGTKILVNERCMITVNEEEQQLFYTPIKKAPKTSLPAFDLDLDSVLGACDSARYIGMLEGMKGYRFFAHAKEVPVMEMYLNAVNNRIVKLCYYYNEDLYPENNKVEVYYNKWDITPNFNKEQFSEQQYVIVKGGTIMLSPTYDTYTLILNEPTE
jgi:hypothetical protein